MSKHHRPLLRRWCDLSKGKHGNTTIKIVGNELQISGDFTPSWRVHRLIQKHLEQKRRYEAMA